MDDGHGELIARILRWAEGEGNVRAVVATGSWARDPEAADRFSDRDVELIVRDPAPLLADDAWIHRIAPVWASEYLDNGDDPDTRLIFFEGARKVDFTIAGEERLRDMIAKGALNDLYARGYRVLLDRDGLAAGLPPVPASPPGRGTLPDAAAFNVVAGTFWFEAAHMPGYLAREELWVVKFRDWTMKELLLRMLEWHALATRGPGTDVHYIGTRMRRWVDDATWAELHGAFGRFDVADSWRAILAMADLFARLTHETAAALDLDYPRDSERHIIAWLREMAPPAVLEGRSGGG